jgi:L-ascorbate metabolism protein UlaG (beta-lactamase superfamily)
MTLPRSDHFNGKTFFQSHHDHAIRRRDFWRWRFTAKPKPWPARVELAPQPPPPTPRGDEIVATWIGHASFLLQTARGNVLIDPVFSERASPVTWAGPRRAHPPGVALADLPPIAAVLLSHDHYDHCDLASLRALAAAHAPLFVAPLRHDDLLREAGARRVVELDWWQTHALAGGATVTLTPSKHWSNRFGRPRNHRLWGGFYLNFESTEGTAGPARRVAPAGVATRNAGGNADRPPRRIWFVGDSGYDAAIFREVRERCGAPDLALVPIGAYEPRWFMAPMHMNPAEAVQLHRDVRARLSVGMHWGTFRLTDEGREDPLDALRLACTGAGVDHNEFRILAPGESLVV